MLTDEQVTKFQTIYRDRFGKEISRSDALEKGARLVRLMQIVYQPITERELLKFQKRRETKTLMKIKNITN